MKSLEDKIDNIAEVLIECLELYEEEKNHIFSGLNMVGNSIPQGSAVGVFCIVNPENNISECISKLKELIK